MDVKPFLVAGRSRTGDGETIPVRNPYDGSVVADVAEIGRAHV